MSVSLLVNHQTNYTQTESNKNFSSHFVTFQSPLSPRTDRRWNAQGKACWQREDILHIRPSVSMKLQHEVFRFEYKSLYSLFWVLLRRGFPFKCSFQSRENQNTFFWCLPSSWVCRESFCCFSVHAVYFQVKSFKYAFADSGDNTLSSNFCSAPMLVWVWHLQASTWFKFKLKQCHCMRSKVNEDALFCFWATCWPPLQDWRIRIIQSTDR